MPKSKQHHFQIERLYRQASTNNAAANSINLTAGQASQNFDEAHQIKTSGFLSHKTQCNGLVFCDT